MLINSNRLKENILANSKRGRVVLFPGSFNPFHAGHEFIVNDCWNRGESVLLEISVVTIDKPLIDSNEIGRRRNQIESYFASKNKEAPDILVTALPLLNDKFALMKEVGFTDIVIAAGIDCIPRLATTNILSRLPFNLRIYNRCKGIELINTPESLCDISSTKLRNENSIPRL